MRNFNVRRRNKCRFSWTYNCKNRYKNICAGVAGTFFADGSYITAGIITATTFHGSGANLTGIDATKIQTGNTTVETTTSRIDNKVNNVGVLTVTASGAKVTGIVTVFGTGID